MLYTCPILERLVPITNANGEWMEDEEKEEEEEEALESWDRSFEWMMWEWKWKWKRAKGQCSLLFLRNYYYTTRSLFLLLVTVQGR